MTWPFQGAAQRGLSISPLEINNHHPNVAEVVKAL